MPVSTSLCCASLGDLKEAVQQGFAFPAMLIPFGADGATPCRFFSSVYEIGGNDFQALIDSSYPMPDGVRRVHAISTPQSGIAPFNPGPVFFLISS